MPLSVDLSGNLRSAGGGGGGGTVDQGNPNTVANGWPVKVTDGTDVLLVNTDGSLSTVLLDTGGVAIDPATKQQLPAALVGGRLDVVLGATSVTQPTSNAAASQVDGHSVTIGATTDLEAVGDGTVVAILKRLRTLLAGGLPAALVGGRLDVNIGASGITIAVSSTQLPAALVGGRLDINLGAVSTTVPTSNAAASQVDGHSVTIGATTDVESASGNGTVVAILKRLRTLFAGGLPAALVGGRLDVNVGAALPAGTNNIGDVDVLTLPSIPAGTNNIGDVDIASGPTGASALQGQGAAAHDAAVAGNPVLQGGYASTNEPTAVSADGDAVRAWYDPFGRQVVLPGHANPETPVSVNATASGDTAVIATPGASLSLYICKASVHNAGASAIKVALQENGSATDRWKAELAPDGGGSLIDFGARGWKLTANTGLDVNLSAAGDVQVNITEYYIAA